MKESNEECMVSTFTDCMTLSKKLEEVKIKIHPVFIAEAHDIDVSFLPHSELLRESLAWEKAQLKKISRSTDPEKLSEIMEGSFGSKEIMESGNKRMLKLCIEYIQANSLTMEELQDLQVITFIGSEARARVDQKINAECLKQFVDGAQWPDNITLVKTCISGSEGKVKIVRAIIREIKGTPNPNDLRQLLLHISPTAEPELHQEVVKFITSQDLS